jgi:hypothetical protein
MKIFIAETAEDIDNWQCAYSVFSGKSCNGKHCKICENEVIK